MKTQEKNKYSKSENPFRETWDGVPATKRRTLFEKSLLESIFTSFCCHIIGLLLIWAITFAVVFFWIAPKLFPPPTPKVRDIEFVLKDTSRHKIHHRKIVAPQSSMDTDKASIPAIPEAHSATSNATDNAPPASTNRQKVSSKNVGSKNNTKSKSKTNSSSGIPDASMPMPNLRSMSSGLGGSGRKSHKVAGFDSSSAGGFNSNSSSSTAGGSGSSAHSGFDKNTTRKMISAYDISPYVNELKRNIRWNWKTPKSTANKRVDLFLRIAKDGRVVILNVKRTSEVGEIDNAALNAVKKSLPLNPLPAKYSKSYLDVIFTFDSNSIGSRY